MRGTAAWALGRIGGLEAMAAVKQGLEQENHETVLEMLHMAEDKLLNLDL